MATIQTITPVSHRASPTPRTSDTALLTYTGQTLLTYHGHSRFLNSVAWSPDGKRIASSDDRGTVQVWDACTGGNVFVYTGLGVEVFAAAWSQDGTRIVSGGSDSTVQIWKTE